MDFLPVLNELKIIFQDHPQILEIILQKIFEHLLHKVVNKVLKIDEENISK
jgi:hypothetical protein